MKYRICILLCLTLCLSGCGQNFFGRLFSGTSSTNTAVEKEPQAAQIPNPSSQNIAQSKQRQLQKRKSEFNKKDLYSNPPETPQYSTIYERVTPSSAAAKACVAKCGHYRGNCRDQVISHYQVCAQASADSTDKNAKAKCRRIRVGAHQGCNSRYNQCFTKCGGKSVAKRVCTSGCDNNKKNKP